MVKFRCLGMLINLCPFIAAAVINAEMIAVERLYGRNFLLTVSIQIDECRVAGWLGH